MFRFKNYEFDTRDAGGLDWRNLDFVLAFKKLKSLPNFKDTVIYQLLQDGGEDGGKDGGEDGGVCLCYLDFEDVYGIVDFYVCPEQRPRLGPFTNKMLCGMLYAEYYLGLGQQCLDFVVGELQAACPVAVQFDLNAIDSNVLRKIISERVKITLNNMGIVSADLLPMRAADDFTEAIFDHLGRPGLVLVSVNTHSFGADPHLFGQYLHKHGKFIEKIIFNSEKDNEFLDFVLDNKQLLSALDRLQFYMMSSLLQIPDRLESLFCLKATAANLEKISAIEVKMHDHKYRLQIFKNIAKPPTATQAKRQAIYFALCSSVAKKVKIQNTKAIEKMRDFTIPNVETTLKKLAAQRKSQNQRLAEVLELGGRIDEDNCKATVLVIDAINPHTIKVKSKQHLEFVLENIKGVRKLRIRCSAQHSYTSFRCAIKHWPKEFEFVVGRPLEGSFLPQDICNLIAKSNTPTPVFKVELKQRTIYQSCEDLRQLLNMIRALPPTVVIS